MLTVSKPNFVCGSRVTPLKVVDTVTEWELWLGAALKRVLRSKKRDCCVLQEFLLYYESHGLAINRLGAFLR